MGYIKQEYLSDPDPKRYLHIETDPLEISVIDDEDSANGIRYVASQTIRIIDGDIEERLREKLIEMGWTPPKDKTRLSEDKPA